MHISFSDFRSYLHNSGIRAFSIGFISRLLIRLDFFFSINTHNPRTQGKLPLTPQSQTKVNGKVQPWSLLKHERRHVNVKFFVFFVKQYCSNDDLSSLTMYNCVQCLCDFLRKQKTNNLSLNPFDHFAIGVEEALTSFQDRASLLLLIQIPLGASNVQRQRD